MNADQFLVYGTMTENQVAFIIAVKDGKIEAAKEDVLPETWKGVYAEHRMPFDADLKPSWAFLSHIICLESNNPAGGHMMFGPNAIVRNDFVILWYSEERDRYYHIHCDKCAIGIARYLIANQEVWTPATTMLQ